MVNEGERRGNISHSFLAPIPLIFIHPQTEGEMRGNEDF